MNAQDHTIKLLEQEDFVNTIIDKYLEQVPKDYPTWMFKNEYEYILNEMKKDKKALNKKLKNNDTKYSDSWLETNIKLIHQAIEEVKKKI